MPLLRISPVPSNVPDNVISLNHPGDSHDIPSPYDESAYPEPSVPIKEEMEEDDYSDCHMGSPCNNESAHQEPSVSTKEEMEEDNYDDDAIKEDEYENDASDIDRYSPECVPSDTVLPFFGSPMNQLHDTLSNGMDSTSSIQSTKTRELLDAIEEKPILPKDCITNILSFVSSPETLLSVSKAHQQLKQSITVDLVVRCVMMTGTHGFQSMTNLYGCYLRRSVYIYQAIPLLEMVCSKKCIKCKQNFVQGMRPGIGACICWPCITDGGSVIRYPKNFGLINECPHYYNEALSHKRSPGIHRGKRMLEGFVEEQVSQAHRLGLGLLSPDDDDDDDDDDGRYYTNDAACFFLKENLHDSSGEKVGSIMTKSVINPVLGRIFEEFRRGNISNVEQVEQMVDDYIVDVVGAPSVDDPGYEIFINAYRRHFDDAELGCLKNIQDGKMCNDRYVEKKRDATKKAIERIENKLMPELRFLMAYLHNPSYYQPILRNKYQQHCIKMYFQFVDEILREYLERPSKIQGALLMRIVQEIERRFYDRNLSDMAELRYNFRTALKWYYKSQTGMTYYYCHEPDNELEKKSIRKRSIWYHAMSEERMSEYTDTVHCKMANDLYVEKKTRVAIRALGRIANKLKPQLVALLSFRINTNYYHTSLRNRYQQNPIKMSYLFMDKLLRRYLKCPSKIHGAVLMRIVRNIERQYANRSIEDMATLYYNHKTVLKWYYKSREGNTYYFCHDHETNMDHNL